MPRLWLIDDTPSLHRVAASTTRQVDGWDFTGWYSGSEAIEALELGEPWPDVVLMDYYIGPERGNRVTAHLRAIEPGDHRPVIIGYSSMRSGSEAIVAAGGDLILPKHQDDAGINPALRAYLARFGCD